MKQTLFLLLVAAGIVALTACHSGATSNDLPGSVVANPATADSAGNAVGLPVIVFEKDFHDFGQLISGEKVTYSFKFTNSGKGLLVISNVSTSCGCTVSDFPKQPIRPGAGGTIDVSFDSENRHGIQSKTITVFTNAQPPTSTLRIQSSVVEPEEVN